MILSHLLNETRVFRSTLARKTSMPWGFGSSRLLFWFCTSDSVPKRGSARSPIALWFSLHYIASSACSSLRSGVFLLRQCGTLLSWIMQDVSVNWISSTPTRPAISSLIWRHWFCQLSYAGHCRPHWGKRFCFLAYSPWAHCELNPIMLSSIRLFFFFFSLPLLIKRCF